jgi:hypothetical protein
MFTLLVFSMGIVVSLFRKSHAILFFLQPLEALDRVETADKCSFSDVFIQGLVTRVILLLLHGCKWNSSQCWLEL